MRNNIIEAFILNLIFKQKNLGKVKVYKYFGLSLNEVLLFLYLSILIEQNPQVALFMFLNTKLFKSCAILFSSHKII